MIGDDGKLVMVNMTALFLSLLSLFVLVVRPALSEQRTVDVSVLTT